MSDSTYKALAGVLLYGSLLALAIAAAYLIAAVVGWKGPNRRRRLVRFAGFLALFPALVGAQQYLQWGIFMPQLRQAAEKELLRNRPERFAASTYVSVGDQAPSFELVDADGTNFSLDGSRDKVVLLNFFATWCGPCLKELPRMQKIWDRHGKNDHFSMLVIGREESLQAVTEFRTKNGYTFPIAPDPNRDVFSQFAKDSIPRIFLISPDGEILYATLGYHEDELDRLETILTDSLKTKRSTQ
jgi:peroxiredoxin